MNTQTVEVNGEFVEFPADMSDADIADIIATQIPIEVSYDQYNSNDMPPVNQVIDESTMPQKPEYGVADYLKAGLETAATVGSGATTGTLGMLYGTAEQGLKEILFGNFGTNDAADRIEQRAMDQAAFNTYAPSSPLAQEWLGMVEPVLGAMPPVIGHAPPVNRPRVGQLPYAVDSVAELYDGIKMKNKVDRSVGAAETGPALQRQAMAESLGFTGDSGLTTGQLTRNPNQVADEAAWAKQGFGAPLQERYSNQVARTGQIFDDIIESYEPTATDALTVGDDLRASLRARERTEKNRLAGLYSAAEQAGETAAPVNLAPLRGVFDQLYSLEGVAKNIPAIKREAYRLGLMDENGQFLPSADINSVERLRQFANKATDFMDNRHTYARGQIVDAIDAITEAGGGDLYAKYRKARTNFAKEFENSTLTRDLLGTRGTTDEMRVATEKIVDRALSSSTSAAELMKTVETLRNSSTGQQALANLRAATLEWIREKSLTSKTDMNDNPVPSPVKMAKVINDLDKSGKLDLIFSGKSQKLRDLADVYHTIKSPPEGAPINYSNTAASLIRSGLTEGAMMGIAFGLPVPAITGIKAGKQMLDMRKMEKKVQKALEGRIDEY